MPRSVTPRGPRATLCAVLCASLLLTVNADPCGGACDLKALPDPKDPSSEGTDMAAAVDSILSGIFEAMSEADGKVGVIGIIGSGVMLLTGSQEEPNPAAETYKIQTDIKKSTDYLACKIDAMTNDINFKAEERTNEAELRTFENNLRGIQQRFFERCASMNCLNYTSLLPSQRNAFSLDCATDQGANSDCPVGKAWDPENPTYCMFNDAGVLNQGICDPNGHCYDVFKVKEAVDRLKDIEAMFTAVPLNNFNNFDNRFDVAATLALAKGALLRIIYLNQIIMLDGTSGTNGVLVEFARSMADRLEDRYQKTLDRARLRRIVDSLSVPNTKFSNIPLSMVEWPGQDADVGGEPGSARCYCGLDGIYYVYRWRLGRFAQLRINAKVRTSCDRAAQIEPFACNNIKQYIDSCGEWSEERFGRSCPGAAELLKPDGKCKEAWDRCINDSGSENEKTFTNQLVGPYNGLQTGEGKLNTSRCASGVQRFSFEKGLAVEELRNRLISELSRVRSIITTLRNIASRNGMPRESFGILRKRYPLMAGRCALRGRSFLPANPNRGRTGGNPLRPIGGMPGRGINYNYNCPSNCERCTSSFRCTKCKPGFKFTANKSFCV